MGEEVVAGAFTMARVGTAGIQLALFHRITLLSIRWCQSRLLVHICRMAEKDLPEQRLYDPFLCDPMKRKDSNTLIHASCILHYCWSMDM